MGQTVGPIGQLFVGAAAAVADQRRMVAKAFVDHRIGQLNRGIQIVRVVKPHQLKGGPLVNRRQPVAGKCINMRAWSQHRSLP